MKVREVLDTNNGLNPYFIGLSTLIGVIIMFINKIEGGLNPYFIGLSTLIRNS